MNSKPVGEPRLEQALEKLSRLHPKKIDLSLGRIKNLLAKLDHPETKLPPVIHVAGTNGKGSVTAYLRSILEAAGLKVHVYTSPHLISFRERMRVAGELIKEDKLISVLDECEQANGNAPVTFFEITTAAALLAFSRAAADICLLEVGLGGRLDATNVIEKPLATVITPVGLDHAEFLGDTLAGVAAEKAAIAKKDVPVFVAHQNPEAYGVIKRIAAKAGAMLLAEERDWAVKNENGGQTFTGFGRTVSMPVLPLMGQHQYQNAGTAIACLLGQEKFEIPNKAILDGLKNTQWPARFQKLDGKAFSMKDATIWLDGGHNPLAGKALARTLDGEEDPGRPLYIIAGMLGSKDAAGFLRPIAPYADKVFAVPVEDSESALSPEALCKAAISTGLKAEPAKDVRDALSRIEDKNPQVLITGSLYLAGSVLKNIGWQPK